MPSALDKLKALKAERDRLGLDVLLEVDGGVNEETGKLCVEAGADALVVGSALFKASDLGAKAKEYMEI
jgi:ribulose-phosphate 3-epimerase